MSKDAGIPLKFHAAGAGGKALSTQSSTATSSSKTVFSLVLDANAFAKGLGRDSSSGTELHRNALTWELRKPGGADLAKVKQHLQALVGENMARCNGQTPERLHLYMGFGNVAGTDRKSASALAATLRDKARELEGSIDDAASRQMLGWMADDWGSYSRIHAQDQAGGSDTKAYRQPTPRSTAKLDDARSQSQSMFATHETAGAGDRMLASLIDDDSQEEQSAASGSQELKQPKTTRGTERSNFSGGASTTATSTQAAVTTITATATTTTSAAAGVASTVNLYTDLDITHASAEVILARAKLRDELMIALAEGDDKKLTDLLQLLPPSLKEPAYYYPAPDLDPETSYGASYETLLPLSEAYADANPQGVPLRMFVEYCSDVEQMAIWSKDFRTTWAGHATGAQKVCSLLSRVKEAQLVALAKSIAPVITAAVADYKTLADDLAAQPIAKLTMLRNKCTVLAPYVDSTVLEQFLQAIKDAGSLQRKAIRELRDELLKYPVNEAMVMRHLMIECAKASTADLVDNISGLAKPAELLTMKKRLTELSDRIASGATPFTPVQARAVKFMVWKLDLVIKDKPLWAKDLNKHMLSKG